jgi:hypothetical protein
MLGEFVSLVRSTIDGTASGFCGPAPVLVLPFPPILKVLFAFFGVTSASAFGLEDGSFFRGRSSKSDVTSTSLRAAGGDSVTAFFALPPIRKPCPFASVVGAGSGTGALSSSGVGVLSFVGSFLADRLDL